MLESMLIDGEAEDVMMVVVRKGNCQSQGESSNANELENVANLSLTMRDVCKNVAMAM